MSSFDDFVPDQHEQMRVPPEVQKRRDLGRAAILQQEYDDPNLSPDDRAALTREMGRGGIKPAAAAESSFDDFTPPEAPYPEAGPIRNAKTFLGSPELKAPERRWWETPRQLQEAAKYLTPFGVLGDITKAVRPQLHEQLTNESLGDVMSRGLIPNAGEGILRKADEWLDARLPAELRRTPPPEGFRYATRAERKATGESYTKLEPEKDMKEVLGQMMTYMKENPDATIAEFAKGIIADPELLLPFFGSTGGATKLASIVARLGKLGATSERAVRGAAIATQMGAEGAAVNVGVELGKQFSTGEYSKGGLEGAAVMGAVPAGAFGLFKGLLTPKELLTGKVSPNRAKEILDSVDPAGKGKGGDVRYGQFKTWLDAELAGDAMRNAETTAQNLMQKGANFAEVEAAIRRNPKVADAMDAIRARREDVAKSRLGEIIQGEVLDPTAPPVRPGVAQAAGEVVGEATEVPTPLEPGRQLEGARAESVRESGIPLLEGPAATPPAGAPPPQGPTGPGGRRPIRLPRSQRGAIDTQAFDKATAPEAPASTIGHLEDNSPYTLLTISRLAKQDPSSISFLKTQVENELGKADVSQAEREVIRAALADAPGDRISATDLFRGVRTATGDWDLFPTKETEGYSQTGLDNIGRHEVEPGSGPRRADVEQATIQQNPNTGLYDVVGPDGDLLDSIPVLQGLDPQEALANWQSTTVEHLAGAEASTTYYNLKPEMQVPPDGHFGDKKSLFGWLREFVENGISHVVEIQQNKSTTKPPKRMTPAELAALTAREEGLRGTRSRLEQMSEVNLSAPGNLARMNEFLNSLSPEGLNALGKRLEDAWASANPEAAIRELREVLDNPDQGAPDLARTMYREIREAAKAASTDVGYLERQTSGKIADQPPTPAEVADFRKKVAGYKPEVEFWERQQYLNGRAGEDLPKALQIFLRQDAKHVAAGGKSRVRLIDEALLMEANTSSGGKDLVNEYFDAMHPEFDKNAYYKEEALAPAGFAEWLSAHKNSQGEFLNADGNPNPVLANRLQRAIAESARRNLSDLNYKIADATRRLEPANLEALEPALAAPTRRMIRERLAEGTRGRTDPKLAELEKELLNAEKRLAKIKERGAVGLNYSPEVIAEATAKTTAEIEAIKADVNVARRGTHESMVRFATANTVAEVEGWHPRSPEQVAELRANPPEVPNVRELVDNEIDSALSSYRTQLESAALRSADPEAAKAKVEGKVAQGKKDLERAADEFDKVFSHTSLASLYLRYADETATFLQGLRRESRPLTPEQSTKVAGLKKELEAYITKNEPQDLKDVRVEVGEAKVALQKAKKSGDADAIAKAEADLKQRQFESKSWSYKYLRHTRRDPEVRRVKAQIAEIESPIHTDELKPGADPKDFRASWIEVPTPPARWTGTGPKSGNVPVQQLGRTDQNLLATLGATGAGAALGMWADREPGDRGITGAIAGGALGLGLATRGGRAGLKELGRVADANLGLVSTRIRNISEPFLKRARDFEAGIMRKTHERIQTSDTFLKGLKAAKNPELDLALKSNDMERFEALLPSALRPEWERVKTELAKVGEDLKSYGILSNVREDYFPRIVKDREGLLEALGREHRTVLEDRLKKAEAKAIAAGEGPLSVEEQSIIINKWLQEKIHGGKPGFASQRKIRDITEALDPFYASNTEALHSYFSQTTAAIERAKFFGKNLVTKEVEGRTQIDLNESIGKVTAEERAAGNVNPLQEDELRTLLRARFESKATSGMAQDIRNAANIGLLGNFFSAGTQLSDLASSVYTQGLRPTLEALASTIRGKGETSARDFGLIDHVAEEFASTRKSAKALNTAFKLSGFSLADQLGKNTLLNAALSRYRKLAKSEKGEVEIARKYSTMFGKDYQALLGELRSGTLGEHTQSLLFSELSDAQPISKLEHTQTYLESPKSRILYMLKSFTLKQADIVRRDVYNELKNGNRARALANMTKYAVAMGAAGATMQEIKDWILGKGFDPKAKDFALNFLKSFALSEYTMDKIAAGKPLEAAANVIAPPFKMFDEIVRGDPDAIRYLPLIGPFLYGKSDKAQAKPEKGEKRNAKQQAAYDRLKKAREELKRQEALEE